MSWHIDLCSTWSCNQAKLSADQDNTNAAILYISCLKAIPLMQCLEVAPKRTMDLEEPRLRHAGGDVQHVAVRGFDEALLRAEVTNQPHELPVHGMGGAVFKYA